MKSVVCAATWLAKAPAWFAAVLVGCMMGLVTLDVLLKYLLHAPVPMTLELVSAYFMPAICFLPLGQVTRTESHLEVELFTQNLTGRWLAGIKLLGCLVGLGYVAVMLDENIAQAMKMTERGEYWEAALASIPVWPSRWFLPVGAALMILWLVLHALNHLAEILSGSTLFSPAVETDSSQAHASKAEPTASEPGSRGDE